MIFLYSTGKKIGNVNNRQSDGNLFPADVIQKVWEKAQTVEGQDPSRVRKDWCGPVIRRDMFGHTSATLSYGWEIDHIKPVALGGPDDILNLQPLQWENNRHKGNAYPQW